MSNKTLVIALALSVDGTVDKDATLISAANAIDTYVAERETELSTIADAVHAVFDQYKGASINMPALAGFALQRLNVQPANFAALEERVMDYVRDNADQPERKDKDGKVLIVGEDPRTRTFHIGKGKGGGVFRWNDRPVKPTVSA